MSKLKSTSDAEWGRVLWDWLREMLPDAGCCVEFDTEDLMRLAEKHGRARKVKYDPAIHGDISDVEPGDEIWAWGDDLTQNDKAMP
jgi:hypothetical protein